jgi:hypothetical protein
MNFIKCNFKIRIYRLQRSCSEKKKTVSLENFRLRSESLKKTTGYEKSLRRVSLENYLGKE